MQTEVQQGSTP